MARRFTRVAGVAAVVGAMLVGPLGLGPAGADLSSFSATSTGFALRVTVDFSSLEGTPAGDQLEAAYQTAYDALPAAAQAELPDAFPYVVDQYFAKSTSDASSSVTKAVSNLGEGFLDLGSVSADSVGQNNTSNNPAVQVPPVTDALDVSVLEAVTGVLRAVVSAGPKVDGEATLAEVNASLANVAGMLPVEVQQAYAALQAQVNAAVATADAELDAALGTVAQTIVDTKEDEALAPITGDPVLGPIIDSTTDDVTALTTELQNTVNLPQLPDPLAVDVAKMTDVANSATAQKTADGKSSADASSVIKAADILDGFLSAGLIDLASHSEAAGTAGSAKNSSSCTIADVRLGDTAGVSVDGTGVYVNGVNLPVDTSAVDDLKAQVDGVLETAGITYQLCANPEASAAEDGSSASNSLSAFIVVFEPKIPDAAALAGVDPGLETALGALGLAPGDSLVKVTVDPTVQTTVSAAAATSPAALPRTGAPVAATMLSGLLLAAGALGLRRKLR